MVVSYLKWFLFMLFWVHFTGGALWGSIHLWGEDFIVVSPTYLQCVNLSIFITACAFPLGRLDPFK